MTTTINPATLAADHRSLAVGSYIHNSNGVFELRRHSDGATLYLGVEGVSCGPGRTLVESWGFRLSPGGLGDNGSRNGFPASVGDPIEFRGTFECDSPAWEDAIDWLVYDRVRSIINEPRYSKYAFVGGFDAPPAWWVEGIEALWASTPGSAGVMASSPWTPLIF